MLPLFSRLRLGVKFFLMMMVLVISLIGAVVYFVYSQQEESILAEVEARADDLVTVLVFAAVRPYLENDYLGLQDLVDNIKNRDDVRQVMLLNLDGKVLAHNYVAHRGKVYDDSLTLRMLRSDDPFITVYRKLKKENVVDVAAPAVVSGKKIAAARVIISLHAAEHAIRSMARRIFILGGISMVVVLALVALFSRLVTQPLRKLHGEARQISRGQREIQIQVTARDEIGTLQQALKTMIDEVRLRSRLAALGATMANLSHELRAPLAAITKYINEATAKAPEPGGQVDVREKVLGEINRLNDLVGQLLLFSKNRQLVLSRTHINALIEQAFFLLETPIKERRITVNLDLATLPTMAADKNRLQSVFNNLLSNAIEAVESDGAIVIQTRLLTSQASESAESGSTTPSSVVQADHHLAPAVSTAKAPRPRIFRLLRKLVGRLFVAASDQVGYVPAMSKLSLPPGKEAIMITIADNGHGIREDLMDKLFLPFFTTKPNGTGLGLALSHQIIQDHHGRIDVESKTGKGTTFTIILPV
jgi:signal transduction histidine kinase